MAPVMLVLLGVKLMILGCMVLNGICVVAFTKDPPPIAFEVAEESAVKVNPVQSAESTE